MIKRVALYTRISTSDGQQTVENQLRDLRLAGERLGWDIVATFADEGISGAKGRDQRPGLDAMLKGIARKEFDMVASWSICRLGRSLQHLVSILGDLDARSVDLYLHVQAIDTSTPSGRAMFGMMGVFAEFERAMISERVKSGLARSTKKGGRPRLDIDKQRHIERLLSGGLSINKTAKKLRVGVGTVWTCPGKVESSLEVKGELDDEAATFHEGIRGGSGPTGGDQWTHATGDSGGSGCRAIDAGALDRPQPGSFGGGTRSSAAGRYGCRVEAASAGERDPPAGA